MDLKFDKMPVDTTLAQDYLQKETVLGKSYGHGDFFDGKQYLKDFNRVAKIPMEVLRSNLKGFAVKLKENKNLIAQLEYLLRKVPISDTIAQLDLIIQQTNYESNLTHAKNEELTLSSDIITVYLGNNSPLLVLGYIAKTVLKTPHVFLWHEDLTKKICHLFTKLCQEAGLPVVSKLKRTDTLSGIFRTPIGTVGVISELSDMDSAVDTFLESSGHVPWRLQRILVQESVYQQFKNALAWKCKMNKQREGGNNDVSSDRMAYNRRVFVLDMPGTTEPEQHEVAIEAYRTRKELRLLLSQYKPHYLSLWANDIAEINEIAHSIPSPIIWVNNFGDFRGPPKVSEALYCHGEDSAEVTHVNGLSELKEAWLKLDLETRRATLCDALDKCVAADPNQELYMKIKDDLQKLDIDTPGAFIDVGINYVCLGIPTPSIRLFKRCNNFLTFAFFKSVLQGNAFALSCSEKGLKKNIDILKKCGIPVVDFEECNDAKNSSLLYCCDYINDPIVDATKVIWTNSGTIFAN